MATLPGTPRPGDFTYTPNPGFRGIDEFTYSITHDGALGQNTHLLTSNVATVQFAVGAPLTFDISSDDQPITYVNQNHDDDNDLVPIYFAADLRSDVYAEDVLVRLVVEPPYPHSDPRSFVRVWDSETKDQEIVLSYDDHPDVENGTVWRLSELPAVVYVEATTSFENLGLTLELASYISGTGIVGGTTKFLMDDTTKAPDTIYLTTINSDLDIDSDNEDNLGPPDRSEAEELIESDTEKAGKFIKANLGDSDNDSIPDFADGFNRDGILGNDDDTSIETFCPARCRDTGTYSPRRHNGSD